MDPATIQTIANLGSPTVILLFAIKEYFAWQKSKGGSQKSSGHKTQLDIDVAVLRERLNVIETNHLVHLKEEIDKQSEWMQKHDNEHAIEREVLWQIAYSMGIKKIPDKPQ